MKVGFSILNFNTPDLTIKLATTVSNYIKVDYVIVVDNASTDDSWEKISKIASDKIKVVETGKNGGYSSGNNYGARFAETLGVDVIFVSNPDVWIEEEDLNAIISYFENSDYSLLTGVEKKPDGSFNLPVICHRNTYFDDLRDCFFIGRKILGVKHSQDDLLPEDIIEIELFRGSFFGIRLMDYLSVGGFDERIFLYCEERILSKKLDTAKKKMGLLPNCKYLHMHSLSIDSVYGKERFKKMKQLFISRLFYNRCYNKVNLFQYLLLQFAMFISLTEYLIVDELNMIKLYFSTRFFTLKR